MSKLNRNGDGCFDQIPECKYWYAMTPEIPFLGPEEYDAVVDGVMHFTRKREGKLYFIDITVS